MPNETEVGFVAITVHDGTYAKESSSTSASLNPLMVEIGEWYNGIDSIKT